MANITLDRIRKILADAEDPQQALIENGFSPAKELAESECAIERGTHILVVEPTNKKIFAYVYEGVSEGAMDVSEEFDLTDPHNPTRPRKEATIAFNGNELALVSK